VRILFAPYGTRGDIQPLIPLAQALEVRGHRITFVAPENSVRWVATLGFDCVSNGVDVEAEVRAIESRASAIRRHVRHLGDRIIPRLFESVSRAAVDADLIVSSGIPLTSSSVAEARGIPHVYALFCPAALPNTDNPPPIVRCQTLPHGINAVLWRAMLSLGDIALRPAIDRGRVGLGLAPARRPLTDFMRARMILAADPELAPLTARMPAASLQADPWIFRDPAPLDPRVQAFVDAGPPPIYVGFGSMVATASLNLGQCVVQAARLAGRRLLVAGGWAALDRSVSASDDVLAISDAPHEKLFPLMGAVVHHGGAGTTTAAARAGTPQVIVPHMLDQFYWARRVDVLGLGPRSLPISAVTVDALAGRISAVTGEAAFHARAREFGSRAIRRDGVPAAVQYLERFGRAPASRL
jgi:vancomycin aglycone glucosyltransferase